MELLINALCFVAGIVFTAIGLLIWARYLDMQDRVKQAEQSQKDMEEAIRQFEEQQKAAQASLQQTIADMVKRRPPPPVTTDSNVASVKERLKRAVEITAQQSKIDTRQGPDFIMQHNELELEKLSVLKTILADGFDPLITIRYSTGDQEMLLSTYVQSITKGLI